MDSCRCAFENNGRFLAFLTPDGRLKVWDCTTGSLKYEYTPPSHLSMTCTCLQWSRTSRTKQTTPRRKKQKTVKNRTNSEGDSIALGTSSGDVLVYNVSAGEINQRLEGGHDSRVNDICWSEDDTTLYSSSNDKHITEWNSEDGYTKCKWKADKHGVRCIRLGPQGHTLLSAGRSIKLWNLETKEALQKFTGHSSPVTQLLFVPSHLSHDTNVNHITCNGVNGHYFISGAEQDRVMNIWLVNLETDSKNALVSLSLTEEPISVHIARYSNCIKPVHIAVVSKDGQLHIFEYSLNGAGKKPLTPTKSIQLASSVKKDETPSPIPIMCARLLSQGDPCVMISYGSVVKPQFETLPYSTMERHTCLIREATSNLLLKSPSQHPFQVDKGQVSHNEVTILGPGNLALPMPSVALDQGKTRKISTAANEKRSSLEDQSIEERLKAINAAASGMKRGKTAGRPTAGSLVQMLVQALHSQDKTLMEDVLRNGGKESLMKNTIRRLPANLAVPLLTELVHKIQASPGRGEHLILWIQQIMSTHMAYLMTAPDLVESLSGLYAMMESRVSVFTKLCKLQGRLDLILSQVDSQNQTAVDEGELAEPSVVYQEEDSEEEPVILREADHSESDENWEEEMASKAELAEEESEVSSEGEEEDEEIESDEDN